MNQKSTEPLDQIEWLWNDLCKRHQVKVSFGWRDFFDPFHPGWRWLTALDRLDFLTAMTPDATFMLGSMVDWMARIDKDAPLKAALAAVLTLESLWGSYRTMTHEELIQRFKRYLSYRGIDDEGPRTDPSKATGGFMGHQRLFSRTGTAGRFSIDERVRFTKEFITFGGDIWDLVLWYKFVHEPERHHSDSELVDSLWSIVQMSCAVSM